MSKPNINALTASLRKSKEVRLLRDLNLKEQTSDKLVAQA